MAYPYWHNVLVVYGDHTQGGQSDIWQFTLRFGSPGGDYTDDPATTALVMDDIRTALETFWVDWAARCSSATRLLGFKFNAVDTEGHYLSDGDTYQYDWAVPKVGTGGVTSALPPQVTIVATLLTDKARGLASKGRIYLPPFSDSQLGDGGEITAATANSIQAAVATFIGSLNTANPDIGRARVFSKVREGAVNPIVAVSVGRRVDIQRRRANKVGEVRGAVTPVVSD